jgi:hypothetical protein
MPTHANVRKRYWGTNKIEAVFNIAAPLIAPISGAIAEILILFDKIQIFSIRPTN